jgi:hypothetical protein
LHGADGKPTVPNNPGSFFSLCGGLLRLKVREQLEVWALHSIRVSFLRREESQSIGAINLRTLRTFLHTSNPFQNVSYRLFND